MNLQPIWRSANPVSNSEERGWVGKFISHRDRNVRDDQTHGLDSEILQGLAFPLKIFNRIVVADAVTLQKTIQLNSRQAQHPAQLRLGDMPRTQLFQSERLQGAAGEVRSGLSEAACHVVRDFCGQLHGLP